MARRTAAVLQGGAAVGSVAAGPGDARGVRRAARCAAAHAREAGRAGAAGGTARGADGGHAGRTAAALSRPPCRLRSCPDVRAPEVTRSDECGLGKEWVRKGRYRWAK